MVLVLVLATTGQAPCYAQYPDASPVNDITAGPERNRALAFVSKMLSALESEDPEAPFLKQLAAKLNPKRLYFNVRRSYQLYCEDDPGEAANVVTLFGFSHGLETLSGPLYLMNGMIAGHSFWALVGTGGPLLSQMLPGIDMGCFIIFGTYLGSPDFQKLVEGARLYSVRGITKASMVSGLSHFLSQLIPFEPVADRLSKMVAALEQTSQVGFDPGPAPLVSLFDASGGPLVRISLQGDADRRYALQSLRFPMPALVPENRAHLKAQTRYLGHDVGHAIVTTFDALVLQKELTLLRSHFVTSVDRRKVGEPCERLTLPDSQTKSSHACACEHHAPHHHHLSTDGSEGLPEGMWEVTFKDPAIQMRSRWQLDMNAGLRSVPRSLGIAATHSGRALLAAPGALTWFLVHSPYLAYQYRWTIPKAVVVSTRIGTQLVVNTSKAGIYLGKLGFRGIMSCGKYLATLTEYRI